MASENEAESRVAGELYTSPLKDLALETHEIYLELLAVGFPPRVVSMIMAQIISDAILYKPEFASDMDDDEDAGSADFYFSFGEDDSDEEEHEDPEDGDLI